MANNTTLPGTGDVIRDIDRSGVKTQVMQLDVGGASAESLVSTSNPLPISDSGGSLTVDGTVAVSGTVATSAASLPLPAGASTETTLAAINTKLGTAPAQDHTTASSPLSVRLTDGTSFYSASGGGGASSVTINDPTTTTQKLGVDASGRITANINGSVAVTGTFFQATQPVSASALPLPTGASTETTLAAVNTKLAGTIAVSNASLPLPTGAAADGTDGTGITIPTGGAGIRGWLSGIYQKLSGSLAVTGTFWQATQPVSASALPLPTGAATSAKQPALGTAGTASTDVITVQGIASGTPQPVSGTVAISGTVATQASPGTSGGYSTYNNINLAATVVNIKASAGQVFGWYIANNATSARFVKFYDAGSAPTVGTGTPLLVLQIPAGGGTNVNLTHGIAFASGINIVATNLVANSDTTAPSTNDVVCNVFYK